jgi:hypothetical protein
MLELGLLGPDATLKASGGGYVLTFGPGQLDAEVLTHKAEVSQLAGAPAEAADSLHEALRIYEDKRALALAETTRTALASLTSGPSTPLA